MRFLKSFWVVLVTLVRLGGVTLSLFLLVISAVLRLLTVMTGTDDSDDGKAFFSHDYNATDDATGIGIGGTLTPGEEGSSILRRKRWL